MFEQNPSESNELLVKNLWDRKLITHPLVKSAFLKATISAPHMHAKAITSLLPYLLPKSKNEQPSEGIDEVCGIEGRPRRVLDIGSGSGFLVHLFAELVGDEGVVVGVDHIGELRNLGETNMRKSDEGIALLESGRVHFYVGDRCKGWSQQSLMDADQEPGWDVIHVGAGAIKLHEELIQQLRSPGRLFIPVAEEESWFSKQYIWTIDKDQNGNVTKTKHYSARYVWLKDAPEESSS